MNTIDYIDKFRKDLIPEIYQHDRPLVLKGFVQDPENFVTWKEVEDIFNGGLYNVEIVSNRQKMEVPQYPYFWNPYRVQDKAFIFDKVNQGDTFVIHQFSQHNPWIASFCDAIEKTFDVICDSHIYGNIGRTAESFCPHIDIPVNFIFQVEGKTKWRIYNNMCSDLLSQNEVNVNVKEDDLEVLFEYELEPGDMLYVPARNFHGAFPDSQRLSISIPCRSKKYNTTGRDMNLDRRRMKIDYCS